MDQKQPTAGPNRGAAAPNPGAPAAAAGPSPAAKGNPASAHNELGAEFEKMGRLEPALESYRRAVALAPNDPESWNNLGTVLAKLNRPEEARDALEKVLILDPRHANAHNNLGIVLTQLGKIEDAVTWYRRAISLNPRHANAYQNLGNAFMRLDQPERGVECYQRASEIAPGQFRILFALAQGYGRVGRLDDAVKTYQELLRINPRFVEGHHGLGSVLQQMGKIDEAAKHFEKALALKPDFAPAFDSLARQKKIDDSEATAESLEALIAREGVSEGEKCAAYFALGRIYEDEGEFDKSFKAYERANSMVHEKYEHDHHVAFIDELMDVFTPALFERLKGLGDPSTKPIFIVGMIRSGTTLTEQIIASHPQVFGAGELEIMRNIARSLPRLLQAKVPFPRCVENFTEPTIRIAARKYLDDITAMSNGEPYVTDKMPGNFFHLGLIHILMPNAKLIHCRRHPLDNCWSAYTNRFATGQQFSYDLKSLGLYYREYARLMDHWRKVLPAPVLEVQYEDLVADQEAQSRRLIDFCGLEWDDKCLEFHKTDRPIRTASSWQVRQPIYSSSVDRWRPYLSHMKPLIDALGDLAPEDARGAQKPARKAKK
jgi:tetratricopeptide (TPR) repeat protein